jgi:hypothetical protein
MSSASSSIDLSICRSSGDKESFGASGTTSRGGSPAATCSRFSDDFSVSRSVEGVSGPKPKDENVCTTDSGNFRNHGDNGVIRGAKIP